MQCQEWVPDPISVAQLYQSYSSKESGITELDWICPGRKDPHASDAEGEVESEEPKYKTFSKMYSTKNIH